MILTAMLLMLCGVTTARAETSPLRTEGIPVARNAFGAAEIRIPQEDFFLLGFDPGDSCDIAFSNGYSLEDIPLYTGFYTRSGEKLICAYPGYKYLSAAICDGDPLWDTAKLSEGDTAAVTLREKGKYLEIQKSLELTYSNDRADYPDDETFANFRMLRGGKMAEGRCYRGASPVDNLMSRAATADRLLGQYGIRSVMDLADTEEELEEFRAQEGFSSEQFMTLYREGRVALLGLGADFGGTEFRGRLADGLRRITAGTAPVYIHCLEGKDRTGFVCALLEALCGASGREISADYMLTYRNYYGITEADQPDRYRAVTSIYLYNILSALTGRPYDTDRNGDEMRECAERYLLDSGMTKSEIDALTAFLTQ